MKKKVLFVVICAVLFSIQADAQKKLSRKEKEELKMKGVKELVESKNFELNIDKMMPASRGMVFLSPTYSIKFSGDSVYCYLPYMGTAYKADIGDSEGGIKFGQPVDELKTTFSEKKGYTISFKANTRKDHYKMTIDVTLSGYVSMGVISTYRQFISYSGELVIPDGDGAASETKE